MLYCYAFSVVALNCTDLACLCEAELDWADVIGRLQQDVLINVRFDGSEQALVEHRKNMSNDAIAFIVTIHDYVPTLVIFLVNNP